MNKMSFGGRAWGALVVCAALATSACGGLGGGEAEVPTHQLRPEHLPELVRFATFGQTTPEQVMAQFTAENLYVTDSVGRDLVVHARGANTGRPYAHVNVTRRTNPDGYIGQLGDDYTLRFEFTNFEPGGPLLLFAIEISQPSAQLNNVCAPAAELASGEGLEGCHPQSIYRAQAPDEQGHYHACVSTPAGYPVEVLCKASAGETRVFRASVTLGRVEEAPEGELDPEAAL